jgi:hypothetical protein
MASHETDIDDSKAIIDGNDEAIVIMPVATIWEQQDYYHVTAYSS